MDGRVVGHIAFSPVTISGGTPDWYGLGPVSVLPEYQRQGIGKALIHEGLSRLRSMQAREGAPWMVTLDLNGAGFQGTR
jgi:putative acetyltransferase